jgi:hypothetical protein
VAGAAGEAGATGDGGAAGSGGAGGAAPLLFDPPVRTPVVGDTLVQSTSSSVLRTTVVTDVRTEGGSICVDVTATTGTGNPSVHTFTLSGPACANTTPFTCDNHVIDSLTVGSTTVAVDVCSSSGCSTNACSSLETTWLRMPSSVTQFTIKLGETSSYQDSNQRRDATWTASELDLGATLLAETGLIKVVLDGSGSDCIFGFGCSNWSDSSTDYWLPGEIPALSHLQSDSLTFVSRTY